MKSSIVEAAEKDVAAAMKSSKATKSSTMDELVERDTEENRESRIGERLREVWSTFFFVHITCELVLVLPWPMSYPTIVDNRSLRL